jgi:signal transduction histidine kinase
MAKKEQTMNLGQDLHDLSQPLTRLQWRLELAKLTGDDAELRDTLTAALQDVGELIDRVRQIRVKTENPLGAKKENPLGARIENQLRTQTENQQDLAGRVA